MLATLTSAAAFAAESASESARANFAYLDIETWHWFALLGFISALVIIDLLLVHRTAHVISTKEAAIESAIWISIGLAFTGVIYWLGTGDDAGQTTFRLRHIYGSWGPILAGQTNSVFMDIDTFPNTVEYWGPNGMAFFRNVQLRYMPIKGDSRVTIALERPGASATLPARCRKRSSPTECSTVPCASASTIMGFLPPSSAEQPTRRSAAWAATLRPVAVEPVNIT